MSFKLATTNHDSTSCEGATFRIYRKTYGRRMELDRRLAEYNQTMRELGDHRQMLWEEAKIKATEKVGGEVKKTESLIQISQTPVEEGSGSGGVVQKAEQIDPQTSPRFQYEMLRALDLRAIGDLDSKATALRLARLRPIYMDVYLHSVNDMEMEDGTPLRYMSSMSDADKDAFYKAAPGELIDEIFLVLADKISMTEEERANFDLPTTGSPAVAGKTAVATTASPARPADSTETAIAASPK